MTRHFVPPASARPVRPGAAAAIEAERERRVRRIVCGVAALIAVPAGFLLTPQEIAAAIASTF